MDMSDMDDVGSADGDAEEEEEGDVRSRRSLSATARASRRTMTEAPPFPAVPPLFSTAPSAAAAARPCRFKWWTNASRKSDGNPPSDIGGTLSSAELSMVFQCTASLTKMDRRDLRVPSYTLSSANGG